MSFLKNLIPANLFGGKAYGIDIGSTSVKILQLYQEGRSALWKLERWAYLPLPGSAEGNPIERPEEVIRIIKEFLAKESKGPRMAAISVSGNSVVVRYVKLPKMSDEQLTKSLPFEAEPYIPFAIPEVNIDFQTLGEVTEEGQQKMETVLISKSCGLKPIVVDIDAFWLQNAVPPPSESAPGETVLVLNMGASVTTMSILEDGICRVVRDVFIAGNAINKTLQKMLGLSPQEAEAAKCNAQIQTETDSEQTTALPEKRSTAEISRAILTVLKDLILEIQRSLDFYLSQRAERQVQKVLLTGGCARIQGIAPYLSNELHLPVEVFDPLQSVSGSEEVPAEIRPHLTIATGLAMRKEGDKK